jgi:hypothetical protein
MRMGVLRRRGAMEHSATSSSGKLAASVKESRKVGVIRQKWTRLVLALLIATPVCFGQAPAAAEKAFNDYVATSEARMAQEQGSASSFLHLLPGGADGPEAAKVKQGDELIEKSGSTPTKVPGGLIHHWVALDFVPGATIPQVLAVLQDYDNLERYYSPEIVWSKLTMHQGDQFESSMRLREHKVITVVLDADFHVQNGRLDAMHQYLASKSQHVAEIADAGSPKEHAGEDRGFMWRLNSYWRFVQTSDGTLVECEAISLTRDIPTGLAWMIGPFLESVPRESLQFTLSKTRDGVLQSKK